MRQRLSTMRNGRTGDWKNRPRARSLSRVMKCGELHIDRAKLKKNLEASHDPTIVGVARRMLLFWGSIVRKKIIISAFILFSFPFNDAIAQRDGNELLQICQNDVQRDTSIRAQMEIRQCLGYVRGLLDGIDARTERPPEYLDPFFCFPSGTQMGQIVDVIVAYLRTNPQTRHLHPNRLAVEALRNAFPCRSRR